ncbi:class GN sortase [Thioalkalivibrio sp. XN279]|uniref:class GN sortase n=1 Tax=Thioalkalivibrio sp. XN279 TaxID=2714953 RepID=UPI001407404F|nr:class GN sortase [Thioalkalivibrio sp. XN279]NHA15411.1 class GN sortase [Thioalkalivibrio sp. XN279]
MTAGHRSLQRTRQLAAILLLIAACASLGQAGWIHAKAWLAQALIEDAFFRAATNGVRPRYEAPSGAGPWPWADTRPVARLHLPGTERPLVVLAGHSGRNLAFAPTHDPASVLPGDMGNSIIAAHRDTHFRGLAGLAVGDRIAVERLDGRNIVFAVTSLEIVDSRRARLLLDADGPRLTLVTCYPFDAVDPNGPWRYVVTAVLQEPS